MKTERKPFECASKCPCSWTARLRQASYISKNAVAFADSTLLVDAPVNEAEGTPIFKLEKRACSAACGPAEGFDWNCLSGSFTTVRSNKTSPRRTESGQPASAPSTKLISASARVSKLRSSVMLKEWQWRSLKCFWQLAAFSTLHIFACTPADADIPLRISTVLEAHSWREHTRSLKAKYVA